MFFMVWEGTQVRGGRIAAYLRLPPKPTDLVLAERILLEHARKQGWHYVRFFRDRFYTDDQWESLYQAVQRGEILGIVMMSLHDIPTQAWSAFLTLVLNRAIRLLTVTEGIDSWTVEGKNLIGEWIQRSEKT
jgi:hypothetical protein